MKPIKDNNNPKISRKEALKKIGNYGKYTALTALGTYMILNPKKITSTVSSWIRLGRKWIWR